LDRNDSLTEKRTQGKPSRRGLLLVGIAALIGAGVWWLSQEPEPKAAGEMREAPRPEPARVAEESRRSPPMATAAALSVARTAAAPVESASRREYDQSPGQPSHPITPEHERIERELALVQSLNDAMDLRDGARMRTLIREHGDEFPEDNDELREGYEIVADCLTHPGAASTAAGQRYFDSERGSTLRRFVHRICLEPHD
jgi:hypothetical protein